MSVIDLFRTQPGEAAAARKPAIYAALDLGAAKTVCFIARTEPTLAGLRPRVIGVGHVSTKGVRAALWWIWRRPPPRSALRLTMRNGWPARR